MQLNSSPLKISTFAVENNVLLGQKIRNPSRAFVDREAIYPVIDVVYRELVFSSFPDEWRETQRCMLGAFLCPASDLLAQHGFDSPLGKRELNRLVTWLAESCRSHWEPTMVCDGAIPVKKRKTPVRKD